jgi:hypothetical protein
LKSNKSVNADDQSRSAAAPFRSLVAGTSDYKGFYKGFPFLGGTKRVGTCHGRRGSGGPDTGKAHQLGCLFAVPARRPVPAACRTAPTQRGLWRPPMDGKTLARSIPRVTMDVDFPFFPSELTSLPVAATARLARDGEVPFIR